MTRSGLHLLFIEKGVTGRERRVWYDLNMAEGRIMRRGKTGRETADFHFAPKLVGRAGFALARGRRELALLFLDNVERTHLPHRSESHTGGFREKASDVLDGYFELALQGPWSSDIRTARAMTQRPALAWAIYGILRESGSDSREAARVSEFATHFPSLLRVVSPSFLKTVVAAGGSLRKAIPYWSPWFREAARSKTANREQAREALLRAALRSMGASDHDAGSVRAVALDRLGFHLPFVRQTRTREAFLVWVARHLADGTIEPDEAYFLYGYVRSTGYLCDRFTTPARLRARHDEWHRRQADRRMMEAVGHNEAFPASWLGDEWQVADHRIAYLRDPRSLYVHAKQDVHNCAFLYCGRIRRGEVQLYRIEDVKGKAIGTVEVMDDGDGNLTLGDRLGPKNEPLPESAEQAVSAWFVARCGTGVTMGPVGANPPVDPRRTLGGLPCTAPDL